MIDNIKMIAFDLFGVIIEEGHLISNGLMPLLPDATDKMQVKKLYDAYNLDQMKEAQFWSGIGIQNHGEIRQTFLDTFTLDSELVKVIRQLEKHYQLSILSNLPADWADELSNKFEFRKTFDPCCFSGHLQTIKPERAIYNILIEKSHVPANQIAFIDDRLENLHTAHRLGLTTIHYSREHDAHRYKPDFKIKRLGELLRLLTSN